MGKQLKTSLLLILIGLILAGCTASPEKVGCEKFTALVEDVETSAVARAGQYDYTTAEIESTKNEINEIASLLGKDSPLPLQPISVVIRLEYMARDYFDLTPPQRNMSWPAYQLWASARGVYYSESDWPFMLVTDGKLAAKNLADACERNGHASPSSDTDVVIEFVGRNCPPHPNCSGCFCDELP